ncbi:hypothetical protein LSAT2_005386 [Lamellibrachia satsuma]|nr:hypothetical protein LSAT2_005386 [Lamellibrachia satsuma]
MTPMLLCFVLAVTVAGTFGQCPPFDAAAQCPNADAGFVADQCDTTCFYTCEQPEGVYTAVRRCCRECESWSQDVLTCIPDDTLPGCEPETTTAMDVCNLLEGSNKYSFVLGETEMVCAAGTIFNVTACECVTEPNPVYPPMNSAVTCITFSNGWNGLSASKGVYAASTGVAVVPNCTPAGGNCGYFDSSLSASMNIPIVLQLLRRLQRALHQSVVQAHGRHAGQDGSRRQR